MPIRFQVDPDFYDHPKVLGMSDAAFALWVRAGSYSAAKLVDGFVAEDALSLFSETQKQAAGELVQRGLWRRVKGGYQFHQYGERNLLRHRVQADREADRERKRAERHTSRVTHEVTCKTCGHTFVTARSDAKHCSAACRKRASREANQQAGTENVHPESRPESGRNPDGIHSASVSVSVSESVSGSGHVPPAAANGAPNPPSPEPPRTCPEHANTPDPPRCGRCADTRRNHDTWQAEQARADQARRSTAARDRAGTARAAIDSCRLCDRRGYLPSGRQCSHDPTRVASTGAAAARAVITRPQPRGAPR